jgi:hypothetical protein
MRVVTSQAILHARWWLARRPVQARHTMLLCPPPLPIRNINPSVLPRCMQAQPFPSAHWALLFFNLPNPRTQLTAGLGDTYTLKGTDQGLQQRVMYHIMGMGGELCTLRKVC